MSDSLHQFEANATNWGEVQGSKVQLHEGEGVLYVKFVALTPQTLEANQNLVGHVDAQPGYIFAGNMQDIRQRLLEAFDEMAAAYAEKVKEQNHVNDN